MNDAWTQIENAETTLKEAETSYNKLTLVNESYDKMLSTLVDAGLHELYFNAQQMKLNEFMPWFNLTMSNITCLNDKLACAQDRYNELALIAEDIQNDLCGVYYNDDEENDEYFEDGFHDNDITIPSIVIKERKTKKYVTNQKKSFKTNTSNNIHNLNPKKVKIDTTKITESKVNTRKTKKSLKPRMNREI